MINRIIEDARCSRIPLFATVSGIVTTNPSMIRHIDKNIPEVTVITTKSFQISPNPGYREPIIAEVGAGSFANAVGLRNPGMAVATEDLRKLQEDKGLRAYLNISLSASSPEDFMTLLHAFEDIADIFELNFSCPHAKPGYGSAIGSSPEIAESYVKALRRETSRPLYVKLTPNTPEIGRVALAVAEAGCDGLVAINTTGPHRIEESHSGRLLFHEAPGERGGGSGRWVRQQALEAINEIREFVGRPIPLIGMGGVEDAEDAAEMFKAGVDIVGIGSRFANLPQWEWASWFKELKKQTETLLAEESLEKSHTIVTPPTRRMEYIPFEIADKRVFGDDLAVFTLDGELPFEAGQFVFVWIPGIGEKPFSLAFNNPATLLIRDRGLFTQHLCQMAVGETLSIRGAYGQGISLPEECKTAYLVGGGTGAAVMGTLAKSLSERGCEVHTYIGLSGDTFHPLLENRFNEYGTYCVEADCGKPGRILDTLEGDLESADKGAFVFCAGPEPFMDSFIQKVRQKGVPDERCYLSAERETRCGVGICGSCVCGEKLLCWHGTFVSVAEWETRND